jgi:sugar phosphate isomerase/epimerase
MVAGRMSIGEWAQAGREAGLDAIDLSVVLIKNHTPTYIKQLMKELDTAGMPILMITTYPDLTHPDSIQREREFAYLKRDIALSSCLKAKYVRITAGQAHPETPTPKGVTWVIEFFKEASSFAAKLGVKLLFENHSKPDAWDFNDFSLPTDIFLEISEKIKDTGIRINFDTANSLVYGDNPLSVLKAIIEQVETVHAADILTKGRFQPTLLGQGIVPFKDIFTLLKSNGFDGWICIEEASFQGTEGVTKAANFVRQKWDEVR